MTINLNNYIQYKESEHYKVYLEKNPASEKVRQMVVVYKQNGRAIQCCANDALFKLLFEPEKFKAEYMKEHKQRSK